MVNDKPSPTHLRQFQESYSNYLRAPDKQQLPAEIPSRRSAVYEELLFNNVCGFLDRCFPVARSLLSTAEWRQLSRKFYRDWSCHTPYFSRIPEEFVHFVQQPSSEIHLDDWFTELLDYEWRELEVDVHPDKVPRIHLPTQDDYRLAINPTLQNLHYQWPVHQISKDRIPDEPKPTFLLVYRSFDHRVHFMEINAMTAALLRILQDHPSHPDQAITALEQLVPASQHQALRNFGRPLLLDLLQKNVVVIR